MENLLFLLATSFVFRSVARPKFKSSFIGDTGCSALLLPLDRSLDCMPTPSGDDLYYRQFTEKKVSYGLICVRLANSYELDEAADMLKVYMNKLRGPYFILHQTGAERDHSWNNSHSRALVDYWQDGNREDWKVKGYTNGKYIGVLFVRNIAEAETRKQELFLESFQFGA